MEQEGADTLRPGDRWRQLANLRATLTVPRDAPPGERVADRGLGDAGAALDGPASHARDDRGLIDCALVSLMAENRSRAARLDAISRFHANRVAETEVRARGSRAPGFFFLTPLQATQAEFGPLLGVGDLVINADLDLTEALRQWFPGIWRRCLEGRLDIGRARLAYEQLGNLTSDADRAAFAELVEEYVDRMDDRASMLCPISRSSFQRAVRRRCLKFPQKDEQDSFAEAFKKRRVRLRTDENGMATLTAFTAVHTALAADYRLTLIAKKLCHSEGETRTLEQLRVDALIDLIHGRLTVAATEGELEEDETVDGRDPSETFARQGSVGSYARPVVNVTVPITTLLGLTDEAGVMAGDTTIPADLARQIAMDPEATWYRLLTDAAGGFLELSTTSYTPTAPIWRAVVARDRECIWPGCCRPATVIEIDHRVAFPAGMTSTGNLQPLCRRHHLVKHSEGFHVVREGDGAYSWTSRFGSTFKTPAPEHPVAVWPPAAGGGTKADEPGRDVGSVIEREFRTWLDDSVGSAST